MQSRNLFLAVAMLGLTLLAGGAGAEADMKAKTATCVACHGANGNSVNPIWPNLAGQGARYIASQLKAFKSGMRNNAAMSPMAQGVADEDMLAIGEYYAGLEPKVQPLGDIDVAAAEKLYRGGDAERGIPACMACHGPSGAGNAPAKYPALRGQHAAYTVAQLKAYRDGTRGGSALAEMMQTIAAKMTDEQIENVAGYVSALY
jgi:cytochrome c553